MSLVFACIAPHGDLELDAGLQPAMEELGRRFDSAKPDVGVLVTPHSVHVEGHFAVVTAGKVGEWETDGAVAAALLEAPVPILGVSYGAMMRRQRSSRSTGGRRCRSSSSGRHG